LEIWGAKLNNYYRENLVAAAFFTDLSDEFAGGGDILHVPVITNSMVGSAKVNGSQVVLDSPTETTVDLTINVWWAVSFLIEDREAAMIKKSYGMQERYMKNVAYAAAAKLDQALLDLFSGFSQISGASNTAVADSDIRGAIKQLDTANVPQEDRAFFFHPKAIWSDLMAIDRFTLVNNTPGGDPVLKGFVGYLYGIPVVKHSNIGVTSGSGYRNALAHKDALIHASTIMRTQANYVPEYLGTLVTADILYGVIENRDTSGVWIKCSSA
jgi:N4-gp56 family major capsid protein